LLHPEHESGGGTAALSREHAVLVSAGGLVTVAGGKWTTYRLMAEQVVDRAAEVGGLPAVACETTHLRLHGWNGREAGPYGSDAAALAEIPGNTQFLHADLDLSESMVRFAIRYEAARTIEDVLARRSRALFLDAQAAAACIDRVGELIAEELAPSTERLAAMRANAMAAARQFGLE